MTWTKEAEELISKAPLFIRPMARGKIEKIAKGKGLTKIDLDLVNEVRAGGIAKG